jgi:hypothetical protein
MSNNLHQPLHQQVGGTGGNGGPPQAQGQMALEQAMQLMMQQQHQIQQQLLGIQAQQQHQMAAPAISPPTAASSGGVLGGARPGIDPPKLFEGGDMSALDDWFSSLERQYLYYQITDDTMKVRTAASHLGKVAWDWWQHLPSKPATYKDFETQIRARFQPVTTESAAMEKLLGLKQGKASINKYVAEFRQVLVHLQSMDEATKLHIFLRGLDQRLAIRCRENDVRTLDAAINMVVRIGGQAEFFGSSSSSSSRGDMMDLSNIETDESEGQNEQTDLHAHYREFLNYMREQRRGGSNRGAGAGRGGSQGNHYRQSAEGQPNRSGGKHKLRGLPPIPHLSPNEVKRHMDEGRCFNCGEKEHLSKDCPKKQSN